MSEEFYRIKRLPPYVIAEVNAMRAAARAAGEDIIDLGMGNPDLPPPQHVIDKLCEVAQQARRARLFAVEGHSRAAHARRRIITAAASGSMLDPESEVVVTMGSKEGLASLATAITAPGDVVLAPNPSYPIHTFGFIIAGATIRAVPTTPDEHYFESLERAMAFTVPRPSILVVNYPSNPTAEAVDLAFYERLVAWAKENKVWILSDLAYSELYYDGKPTPSILQVQGAKDVAVEFTSLSQDLFDGRLADRLRGRQQDADRGDDAGEVLSRLRRLHADPGGRLRRAQRPAGHRREEPRSSITSAATCWSRASAAPAGTFPRPRASMFAWAPLPPALAHLGSLEFSKQLLTHAKVAVAPGVGYGEDGEGFVRIAMVENEQRLRQAARNVQRYLQSMGVNTPAQGGGLTLAPPRWRGGAERYSAAAGTSPAISPGQRPEQVVLRQHAPVVRQHLTPAGSAGGRARRPAPGRRARPVSQRSPHCRSATIVGSSAKPLSVRRYSILRRSSGSGCALEDAVFDQPRQPVGQDVARDAEFATGIPRNDAGR